ncbi:MAG: HYR domain-containing protein, partial [Flavobacteriales bacterium]|nr:HYR domain-containing protein [Flavobacteriales bacterium]
YSHAPGTAFAPGMHTVTVTATDDSGNATSCSFTIDVLPPVEPFLSYPAASFCQGSGSVAP